METTVSASFIYAILGGILSILIMIYYNKTSENPKKRTNIHYAGVFFIVSNIIYYITSPENVSSNITMKSVFVPEKCEMKTGFPTF